MTRIFSVKSIPFGEVFGKSQILFLTPIVSVIKMLCLIPMSRLKVGLTISFFWLDVALYQLFKYIIN
jgi:hypothetical protein